jgi:Flp pilus assembly protein TadG
VQGDDVILRAGRRADQPGRRRTTIRLHELRDDSGAAAIIVALMMVVLIGITSLALDIGRERILGWQLQKTADAAALAGAVYLPTDSVGATTRARATVNQNYPGASTSTRVVPGHPTQLEVTVTAPMTYIFAQIFGFSDTTVSRTGVGEYSAPAPMGSPCNTFGNEPRSNVYAAQPTGSSLPSPLTGAYSKCSNPQFWGGIEGPDVKKEQGDRYMTRTCNGFESGCDGTTNEEFRPEGYFYLIRVLDPARTGPISLQIYDPAFVNTGQNCENLPTNVTNGMNRYAPDATTRYARDNNGFCTGDSFPGESGAAANTSFALRAPVASQNPLEAPVVSMSCIKQFRGHADAPSAADLRRDTDFTATFHQWYQLCTIPNPVAGDYYLQVRTNVAMSGTAEVSTGNSAVVSQAGDDLAVRGYGSNDFALRAVSSDATQVSVAGYQRMPIFANADSASSTFNLIRAVPGAGGKRIKFSFYDAADASGSGSVKVSQPSDAKLGTTTWTGNIANCIGEGVVTGTLTNCSAGVSNSRNNGQLQTIYVPIPQSYTCDYTTNSGCWFQVTITFPGSRVHDFTTWDASIEGDPVRLVPAGN